MYGISFAQIIDKILLDVKAKISLYAVFSLAKLMNVKEDQGQLSAIARYCLYSEHIFCILYFITSVYTYPMCAAESGKVCFSRGRFLLIYLFELNLHSVPNHVKFLHSCGGKIVIVVDKKDVVKIVSKVTVSYIGK